MADYSGCIRTSEGCQTVTVVLAQFFKQGVESFPVVRMPEVRQLMEKDIVAHGLRQAYEIEVKIDVAQSRTAAPIGGIVLDSDGFVFKAIAACQKRHLGGQKGLGFIAQYLRQCFAEQCGQSGGPFVRGVVRVMYCLDGNGSVRRQPEPSGNLDVLFDFFCYAEADFMLSPGIKRISDSRVRTVLPP